MSLTTPTVHLNGTSRQALLDGYLEAMGQIQKAIAALERCAPNGRDYYVTGNDAIIAATREHHARGRKLMEVRDELNVLATSVIG